MMRGAERSCEPRVSHAAPHNYANSNTRDIPLRPGGESFAACSANGALIVRECHCRHHLHDKCEPTHRGAATHYVASCTYMTLRAATIGRGVQELHNEALAAATVMVPPVARRREMALHALWRAQCASGATQRSSPLNDDEDTSARTRTQSYSEGFSSFLRVWQFQRGG